MRHPRTIACSGVSASHRGTLRRRMPVSPSSDLPPRAATGWRIAPLPVITRTVRMPLEAARWMNVTRRRWATTWVRPWRSSRSSISTEPDDMRRTLRRSRSGKPAGDAPADRITCAAVGGLIRLRACGGCCAPLCGLFTVCGSGRCFGWTAAAAFMAGEGSSGGDSTSGTRGFPWRRESIEAATRCQSDASSGASIAFAGRFGDRSRLDPVIGRAPQQVHRPREPPM